jgi:hypothetical protein
MSAWGNREGKSTKEGKKERNEDGDGGKRNDERRRRRRRRKEITRGKSTSICNEVLR